MMREVQGLRYCVLIPTRARARSLARSMERCPWMQEAHYWYGVDDCAWDEYKVLMKRYKKPQWVRVINPDAKVSIAREWLREALMEDETFDYVINTDENCIWERDFADDIVLEAETWFPCILGASHAIFPHFHKQKRERAEAQGHRSYPSQGNICTCLPWEFYSSYVHDSNLYNGDDHDLTIQAALQGFEPRVFMDAVFKKRRFEEGGIGSKAERIRKTAASVAYLCGKYPWMYGQRWPVHRWLPMIEAMENAPDVFMGLDPREKNIR